MEGILSASVDWLTFTAGHKTTEADTLERAYQTVKPKLEQEHGTVKAMRTLGYMGEGNKRLFRGLRADGMILRASSDAAEMLFKHMRQQEVIPHVTRLDLQVTYLLAEDCPAYARELAARLEASYADTHESQRPRRTLLDSHGHGDTLSISTRSRPCFMRIYDKHRESSSIYPPGAWRFEVELKGTIPDKVLPDLWFTEQPDKMIIRLVKSYMAHRGIEVPWDADYIKVTTKGVIEPTTHEKRIEWLRSSVRPAVKELIAAGSLDDVLDALGLTNPSR